MRLDFVLDRRLDEYPGRGRARWALVAELVNSLPFPKDRPQLRSQLMRVGAEQVPCEYVTMRATVQGCVNEEWIVLGEIFR